MWERRPVGKEGLNHAGAPTRQKGRSQPRSHKPFKQPMHGTRTETGAGIEQKLDRTRTRADQELELEPELELNRNQT